MAGWHQTIIIGNVGSQVELRYLPSGAAVASFSVAVNETWNDKQTNERRESTTWYKVSAWGSLGEICNEYVQKGDPIQVVGTVSSRAYTNNAGEAASSLELRARDVTFLGSRDERRGGPAPADGDDVPF